MSETSVALLVALAIGLICGYKAHQRLMWPPRSPIDVAGDVWWALRYSFDDALYSRNDDVVHVMELVVRAQQKGQRISVWDITQAPGLTAKRANRAVESLLDADVLIKEDGCERETLPEQIYLKLPTMENQKDTAA